ncbi:MAG: FliH/SctL family protein [candidate division Zixibacteria bacterium]|nr:FliH/SctL family protein [candidate division Zixibacteria bacterium]MDH3937977.1 FliH/SctL family protein [candidate division Zixibacteria bacterium]MDH4033165.1 FliH/SctL family protein [candidate division Zixibacteria bacterium]
MSKIIRQVQKAPVVYIGEKHLDRDKEILAERKLGELLPEVVVLTDPDGAKLIPVQEVDKVERYLNDRVQKATQISLQDGQKAGYDRGLNEGLAKASEVLNQLDAAIKDAVNQRESLLLEAKQKILDLVIQISRKVTYDAVKADPELTLGMISGVIDSLVDRSRLKIKVHPDHLPIIEQNIESFLKGSTTIKEISIESDPRVRYGGCFIETPTGDIDARLESQFEVIEETILAGEERL